MRKIVAPVLAAAALTLTQSPSWAIAQAPTDAERYEYFSGMMGWGGWWPGMIFGPLLMVLVVFAVVLLVRWTGAPTRDTATMHQAPPARSPIDILRERFARGEIDKQEYDDRRRVLGD